MLSLGMVRCRILGSPFCHFLPCGVVYCQRGVLKRCLACGAVPMVPAARLICEIIKERPPLISPKGRGWWCLAGSGVWVIWRAESLMVFGSNMACEP